KRAEHRRAAIVLIGLAGLLFDDRGQNFVTGVAVGITAARMPGQPVLQQILAEHGFWRGLPAMAAAGALGEDSVDRVVVGVAAQRDPVDQKLLDRCVVETRVDRRTGL